MDAREEPNFCEPSGKGLLFPARQKEAEHRGDIRNAQG
jgi:hypothetical protein